MSIFVAQKKNLKTGEQLILGVLYADNQKKALAALLSYLKRNYSPRARLSDPRQYEPAEAVMIGDWTYAFLVETEALGEEFVVIA